MEKILNKLINHMIKGVDTYTHNGSTWLIFTESKQWVIELTESKTLWYNYNFFKNAFVYVSMDVVENQHYITKWVEDNVINKVKDTILEKNITEGEVEEIIENGVKENSLTYVGKQIGCEDALENGVRHTEKSLQIDGSCVIEDTVQNGVKETELHKGIRPSAVEDTIQNGIKETRLEMNITEGEVDDIIQDGVKLTQFNDNENKSWVEGVIENGIKEVQPLPDQSGELIGYSNYYNLKEDRTKPFIDYLEETIKFGVKET